MCCAGGHGVVSQGPLYRLLLLLLGQRRKTFLTGQRANAVLPATGDDGIGGAWRGRGVKGRDDIYMFGTAVTVSLPFHSSPPILPSSVAFPLPGKISLMASGSVSILFPPSASSRSPGSINHSHRASRCRPIPGELLRMEVIYWWPLCLFSLPLLLVLLSTLLSYLAAEGCLCAGMCVWMCICFTGVPPLSGPWVYVTYSQ